MPLPKRHPSYRQTSDPSSSSPPSLEVLPLVPLGPLASNYPPGSFGRWTRERRVSGKGKGKEGDEDGRKEIVGYGSGGTVAEHRDGGLEMALEAGVGSLRKERTRSPYLDDCAQRTARPPDFSAPRPSIDSSSASPLSPSYSIPQHHDLSRSLSAHSTAPTQATSDSSDPLIPHLHPSTAPAPRKLVKRRPSLSPATPTNPHPFTQSFGGDTSKLPLPAGASPAINDPFGTPPTSFAGLSKNGSSSTTTSSLGPSPSTAGGSTAELSTPPYKVADGHQPNRNTCGPFQGDLTLDELAGAGEGDYETHTSSSSRTARPRSISPGLYEPPQTPSSALDHGRPPDLHNRSRVSSVSAPREILGCLDNAEAGTGKDEGREQQGRAQRLPSVYDFSEILRVNPEATAGSRTRTRTNSSGRSRDRMRGWDLRLGRASPAEEREIADFLAVRDPSPSALREKGVPREATAYHTRPAPAPPHLLPSPSPTPHATLTPPAPPPPRPALADRRSSSDTSADRPEIPPQPLAPPIPDRSSSLGVLWRRMSTRSRGSGSGSASGSGSSSEGSQIETPDEADPDVDGVEAGEKKKVKRPGMIRALSRRRTAIGSGTLREEKERDVPALALPVPLPTRSPGAAVRAASRRHLSVPPSSSRNLRSRPAGISDGWTELDSSDSPSVVGEARAKVVSNPSPPARIPHRYSSLPPRPILPALLIPSPSDPPTTSSLHPKFVSPLPGNEQPRIRSSVTFGTSVVLASIGETGSERKRGFRRTLVEVEDDVQFQRLLQDEHRREEPLDPGGGAGEDGVEEGKVGVAISTDETVDAFAEAGATVDRPEMVDGEGAKHSVQAWFVTRELVQGEKRYGRLLARGVSIVQSVADRDMLLNDFGRPMPTSSSLSSFFSSTGPSKRSKQPPSTSTLTSTSVNQSSASHSHNRFTSHSSSLTPSPSTSLTHLPLPNSTPETPIDLLLRRLPRLLALSLTLSSRFAHDPSPDQVASAFLSMEGELLAEMSDWAGEVGRLIALGFGEVLDREMRGDETISRSSFVDLSGLVGESPTTAPMSAVENRDGRVSFSEILLSPIQRAARYRLLFHSLLNKVPLGSKGREKVQEALEAAERILEGVNKGQGYDLEGLRRGSGVEEGVVLMRTGKKAGREGMGRRVKSMYA